MRYALLAVFALSYVAISARRLAFLPIGRPAAAMVGALAMVLVGAFAGPHGLAPDEALARVEMSTIALLVGMMLLSAALGVAGFFDRAVAWLVGAFPRPVSLLYAITIGSGLLSALLVNDAVCLLCPALVVRATKRLGVPRVPYLLALAMGANAGSALTLAGNPQNMLVARLSGLTYRGYALRVLVPASAALLLTAALLHLLHRRELAAATPPAEADDTAADEGDRLLLRASVVALVLVTVANAAGAHLPTSALVGGAIALIFARERAPRLFALVDWTVLVFFASLFVLVAALQKTGLPAEALLHVRQIVPAQGAAGAVALSLTLLLGSQIVSNVPLILLLQPLIDTFDDKASAWTLTALVSTLAGNLTLLGSVANIIVIEQAGARHEIGFRRYARAGVPVTLASTVVAVTLLWLLR